MQLLASTCGAKLMLVLRKTHVEFAVSSSRDICSPEYLLDFRHNTVGIYILPDGCCFGIEYSNPALEKSSPRLLSLPALTCFILPASPLPATLACRARALRGSGRR